MSEDPNAGEKNTEGYNNSQGKIDVEALTKSFSESARQEMAAIAEKIREDVKKDTSAQVGELLERNKQVARLLAGENIGEEERLQFTDLLNAHPKEMLQFLMQAPVAHMEKQKAAERATENERTEAYRKVLSSRPDITESDSSWELFSTFYNGTDKTKSEADRYKEAVAKVDKLLEDQGAPKVEERIKAAAYQARGGMGNIGISGPVKMSKDDINKVYADAQAKRVEEWERKTKRAPVF